ncbi:hypothetical protein JRO89_XS03G0030800 [Xanthoceras sorbifolium]|uniref:RNase H type-1 domain-containing protein n=1 Tax=Xanthoceras sorbifolium TaxID=99658 RepID=A0ABQ8I8D2_9ROSI|nr:hypothetical protein JRO89_XS03G0030800 [Xanthoceras sorbifolium]
MGLKGLSCRDVLCCLVDKVNLRDFVGCYGVFGAIRMLKCAWCPAARPGSLKLNTDVAVNQYGGVIGLGGAIRNSKVLQSSVSADVGEFMALREGLYVAKQLRLLVALVEVDAVNVNE